VFRTSVGHTGAMRVLVVVRTMRASAIRPVTAVEAGRQLASGAVTSKMVTVNRNWYGQRLSSTGFRGCVFASYAYNYSGNVSSRAYLVAMEYGACGLN